MRHVLALLVLLLSPAIAAAQWTCVATSEEPHDGDTTQAIAFGSVTAGDLLMISSNGNTDETHTQTVADDVNGAWSFVSAAADDPGGTSRKYWHHFLNSASGTVTATVTFSAGQGGSTRGYRCTPPDTVTFEETLTATDGSSTTHASPASTATCSDGLLVFAPWTNSARDVTYDVGTDFGAATGRQHAVGLEFSASGSLATITATASSSARWTSHTSVYCAGGGGPPPTGTPRMLTIGVGP